MTQLGTTASHVPHLYSVLTSVLPQQGQGVGRVLRSLSRT